MQLLLAFLMISLHLHRLLAVGSSINITANLTDICPLVTFTCTAVNLPSTSLRWFFNGKNGLFASYTYVPSDRSRYPVAVHPSNQTLAALVGGVKILILNASLNVNNHDSSSFLSTMKVDVSALQRVGLSNISCGIFTMLSTLTVSFSFRNVPTISMDIIVLPKYNTESDLTEILVQWNKLTVRDEFCIHMVNYTLTLEDTTSMAVLEEREVSIDSCVMRICSATFYPTLTTKAYAIYFTASNMLGSSNRLRSAEIYGSIKPFFNHSLTFENCTTTAICSTTFSEPDNCSIQYHQDMFDGHLSPPVSAPLNSTFLLPNFESSTLYYVQVTFTFNSESVILRRNFTTGPGISPVTSQVLLLSVIGLIMWVLASGACIAIGIIACRKGIGCASTTATVLTSVLVVINLTVFLLTAVLWTVSLAHMLSVTDTCNLEWQATRDNLFILSFCASSIACIVAAITIVLICCCYENLKGILPDQFCDSKEATIEMKQNKVYGVTRAKKGIEMKHNAVYGIRTSKEDSKHREIFQDTDLKNLAHYEYVK